MSYDTFYFQTFTFYWEDSIFLYRNDPIIKYIPEIVLISKLLQVITIMVDLSYSLVLILATVVKFVHGLPIFQETSYEPFPNYLKAFDFDQLNSPLVSLFTENFILIK